MVVRNPSPRQLRAARAMLGLSLLETSRLARLSVSAVSRLEGERWDGVSEASASALKAAFEAEGIAFSDDGSGEAVRLAC